MISLIVNTAAGAPFAKHSISSGGKPHSWRAYALKHFILPAYIRDPNIDEVIVAGSWEEGEGYTYVDVPPVHHTWADCISQRHAGYEAAQGSMLIFQHDDHFLEPRDTARFSAYEVGDVISPARWTRERVFAGEPLNDGSADGYIDGHCAFYRRRVLEKCPWSGVPEVFTLDVEHTKQIRAAGFQIHFTQDIRCWDVEHGASPWL